MNGKEVVMRLRIDTILGDMSKAINGLSEGLSKGVSKIDIGSQIGKNLTKNIQQFKEEYTKFSQLTSGGTSLKMSNSKEAISSGERLIKVYRDIQAQMQTMGDMGTENLKKLFPASFDARINEVRGSLTQLQNSMLALGTKQNALEEATNAAATYQNRLVELKAQFVETTDKVNALAEAEKALANANTDQEKAKEEVRKVGEEATQAEEKFKKLRQQFVERINLNAKGVQDEIGTLTKEIDELIAKRDKLSKGGDAKGAAAIQKQIDAKTTARTRQENRYEKLVKASTEAMGAKDIRALSKQTQYAGVDPKQIEQSRAQIQALAQEQEKLAERTKAADEASAQAKLKVKEATDQQKNASEALTQAQNKNKNAQTEIDKTTKAYEQQTAKVTQLTAEITAMQTKMSTKGLATLKELIPGFDENKLKTTEGIQEIVAQLERMDNQKAEKIRKELENLGITGQQVEQQVGGIKNAFQQVGEASSQINRANQDLNILKSRLEYFFGITNSVMLFRRAVTKALNTVKELDKTMTEAAVVTKFDVSDMWDQLPTYSKHAQKLGVSINGMYQATTLYYQQGLKTNQAMQIGVETMKMAKIAGIESTDATKAMTAALRGFNMELNETSATRVNDVYSQLAAKTAADVSQISTAMEKTASIAASANMEFETTAALLAQIIETTQEAPETAGTAMKTIIARFSEVKSLREQGLSTGQDEEGEGIDVNRIQAALRTVGISMEGFFSGSEGLDSILLKLAEKWGTLDFETQRYIATMAAGSRQQSRFIAMMSDYGRTTELVGEAQNSAGASQRQYSKTLDSMESKVTRLKNAWDSYLMGLANNEILKLGVDLLTGMLQTINKLTDAISGGNGLMKSIVSLTTVIGGLSFGKMLLPKLFGGAAAMMGIRVGANGAPVEQNNSATKWAGVGQQEQDPYARQGLVAASQRSKMVKQQGGNFFQRTGAAFSTNLNDARIEARILGAQKLDQRFDQKSWTDQLRKNSTVKAGRGAPVLDTGTLKVNAAKYIEQNNAHFGKEQMDEINKAYDETLTKTGDATKATEAMATKTRELGGVMSDTASRSMGLSKTQKQLTVDTKALGQAFMGAGAAAGGLATLFSLFGWDEAAEGMSKVAAALFGIGAVASFVLPLLQKGADALIAKGVAVQAAWWWVMLIVAAIAALVAIIVLVKKGIDEASDTKKLEKLTESIAEAAEAANQAKERLDNITEAKKGLDDMANSFKSLTKGTQEWRKALIENNQQVLTLLETYSGLMPYLEKGEHGQLTISEKGWEAVYEQQLSLYAASNASRLSLTSQQAALQQRISTKEMLDDNSNVIQTGRRKTAEFFNTGTGKGLGTAFSTALGSGFGPLGTIAGAIVGSIQSSNAFQSVKTAERKQTGGLTIEEFERFAAEASKQGYNVSNGSLDEKAAQDLLDKLDMKLVDGDINKFTKTVQGLGTDFDELATEVMAAKEAERQRLEATIDSIAATSESISGVERFSEAVKDALTDTNLDYNEKTQEKADEYLKALNSSGSGSEKAQDIVYEKYAEMAGLGDAKQVRAKIESGELSNKTIAQTLAASEMNDKIVKKGEQLTKALIRIESSNKASQITKALSTEGGKLKQSDLQKLGFLTQDNTISKFTEGNLLERLELDRASVQQLYEGLGLNNLGELAKYLNEQAQLAYQTYETAIDRLEGLKLSKEIMDRLANASAETVRGAVENFEKLHFNGMTEQDFSKVFEQILSFFEDQGIEDEDVQSQLLEWLSTADWSSKESLESVANAWADKIGGNTAALNVLFDGIQELTKATTELTLAQIKERGFQINDLLDKIASGEIDPKSLTGEQKDVLSNYLKGKFIQTGADQWTYSGDAYSELWSQQTDLGGIITKKATYDQKKYAQQTAYTGITADNQFSFRKIGYSDEVYGDLGQVIPDDPSKDPGNFVSQGIMGTYDKDQNFTFSDFGTAVKNFINFGTGSMDELFKKAVATNKYTNDDSGRRQFEEDFKQYKQALGENFGDKKTIINSGTANGENAKIYSTQDAVEEILGDVSGWIANADQVINKETGETGLDYIRNIYTQAMTEAGQADKINKNATAKEMIDTLRGIQSDLGQDKYAMFTEAEAKTWGSAVAASSDFVSNYDYQIDEDKLEGKTQEEKDTLQQTSENEYKATVDAMYEQTGAAAFLDKFTLSETESAEETQNKVLGVKQVSVDMAKTEENVKNFAGSLEDLSDSLKESKRGTTEYEKALTKFKSSLSRTLRVDSKNVEGALNSGKFTQKDIEDAAKGDKQAFKRIAEGTYKHMVEALVGVERAGAVWDAVRSAVSDNVITEEEMKDMLVKKYGSVSEAIKAGVLDNTGKVTEAGAEAAGAMVNAAGESMGQVYKNAAGNFEAAASNTDWASLFDGFFGGGGGGSKWKNPFDKLYNSYEEVNKLIREREKLERRYDKLLEQRGVTYKDLLENQQKELDNLEKQRKEQQYILDNKKKETEDFVNSKKGQKYSKYFSYDAETGEINIDWEKVNKLRGSKGEGFEEFISTLEGLRDQWQEAEDELENIEDSVAEIRDRGKDEYFDFEDQIKEALISERQKEIDKLSEINDSINDTNGRLLDSMQEQIDEYRQNRDNEKTEEEIADKQRRLAYLQMDTSGANATEILSLQKEIDEAQEDYTDTLIDQKISELQKQNDQAAEQRQRQIDIMQAQLDQYETSGAVWEDVYALMHDTESFDDSGALKPDGPLARLLQDAAEYTGMSDLGKIDWMQELGAQIASAFGYVRANRRAQKDEVITFTTADGKELSGTADADGNITVDGKTYSGVHQNERGAWVTDEEADSPVAPEKKEPEFDWGDAAYTKPWEVEDTIKKGSPKKEVRGLQHALNVMGFRSGNIDGIYGTNTKKAVIAFQDEQEGWTPTGKVGPKTKEVLKKKFTAYETGGLADFTGPAWLDGTKSKPEYILNADQTKAFFNLIDVLGSLQNGDAKTVQNSGDNTYDIDINVESIGSDYDVDQLADKVKSLINEDARYRNNNTINLMR